MKKPDVPLNLRRPMSTWLRVCRYLHLNLSMYRGELKSGGFCRYRLKNLKPKSYRLVVRPVARRQHPKSGYLYNLQIEDRPDRIGHFSFRCNRRTLKKIPYKSHYRLYKLPFPKTKSRIPKVTKQHTQKSDERI